MICDVLVCLQCSFIHCKTATHFTRSSNRDWNTKDLRTWPSKMIRHYKMYNVMVPSFFSFDAEKQKRDRITLCELSIAFRYLISGHCICTILVCSVWIGIKRNCLHIKYTSSFKGIYLSTFKHVDGCKGFYYFTRKVRSWENDFTARVTNNIYPL